MCWFFHRSPPHSAEVFCGKWQQKKSVFSEDGQNTALSAAHRMGIAIHFRLLFNQEGNAVSRITLHRTDRIRLRLHSSAVGGGDRRQRYSNLKITKCQEKQQTVPGRRAGIVCSVFPLLL